MACTWPSQQPEYRRAYYAANAERINRLKRERQRRNIDRYRELYKAASKRYYAKHKDEISKRNAERNKKRHPSVKRNWKLKWKYGITIKQYDEMLAAQNGLCKICHKRKPRLVVDHDH
jgi:Recombination endonuclease VII